MDFWAQHKDFILKILAGVGVFLVALIARSITYGDELEKEQGTNRVLKGQIESTQVAPVSEIQALERDAQRLRDNAAAMAVQVGWDLSDEDRLEQRLLQRTLGFTRRYARESEANVQRTVEDFRGRLREDLSAGFGQLRLMVRQELVEEAKEKNIKVEEGIGFANVTEVEPNELIQYLLQLELVARVVRYAIDARVDGIEDIVITQGGGARGRDEVIPGANPRFLEEYRVEIRFAASQKAFLAIVNRLEAETPRAPVVGLRMARVTRPRDHVSVELSLLATAANVDVPFAAEKKS